MKTEESRDSALTDVRVLDLAGESGLYCTKLLGDLGADVIKIEPPGGDAVRRVGPFYHDDLDPERSLHFYHFNTSKRSITLNIETEEGRDILAKLVKTADIMVETFAPGYLAENGMGYEELKKINPRLILVSITGFGQTGPHANYVSSDLIGLATGGLLYTIGFPDDPPTTLGASQAYHMASSNAAVGALIALLNRDVTGEGQWVDIAIQGTALRLSEMAPYTYWLVGSYRKRSGLEYYRGLRDVFPCKDGRVICSALGGSGAGKMLDWMESEGMVADLRDDKYAIVMAIMTGGSFYGKGDQNKTRLDVASAKLQDFPEEVRHIEEVWESFLMTHTREELFVGAQERGVRLMPVNDVKSLCEDIGLKARKYFVQVDHHELGESLVYPGPPYRLGETPWKISRRAPLIGEHNKEIYQDELGLSEELLESLKSANVI